MNLVAGKNLMEAVAASLSSLFAGALAEIFGPGVNQVLFGGFTWADLGVMICFLLGTLAANGLAAWLLHRHLKRGAAAEPKNWRHQLALALGKPVYLLIWIYGLYLTATPLLLKLPADEWVHRVYRLADILLGLGVFLMLLWLFMRFTRVLETWLAQLARKTSTKWDDLFVPLVGSSLRVIVPMLGIIFALPVLGLPAADAVVLSKASGMLIICTIAWILFQAVALGEKAALTRYDISVADNLQARKVYTQVHVLGKTFYAVICIFTVGSILMLFQEVRQFGTSILASAGVVGIIIGFAAQKTIANLFAGFQLAMTQPIRLDDVVIVEGEWGRIEEITLTYVVIRIWDDRRLVVPLSYFIEKPFQNWTRTTAHLLGSVFVWVDYSLPLDEIRSALKEIIEPNPLWDKRFWNLQVTDATEKTMQLRVLATSADSSKSWDLRCDIREKLIAYIQKNHPQSLPRFRARLDHPAAETPPKP